MSKGTSSLLYTLTALCLWACAKPVLPSGGPPDEDAPILLTEESEANYQTHFTKKKFELKFDEFIRLQNPIKSVIVSPPTVFLAQFKVRTNTLSIEFNEEEVFKENTTYQINFGDAIRDYNEGNILENYAFVFATGDKIDSLSIKGTVVDLESNKALKDMIIMLYDNLSDTVVYHEKPLYFTRTDKDGNFQINNIRSDTFKLFGLEDSNLNYIFDNDSEKITYLDTVFFLSDSLNYDFKLNAFIEKSEQMILSADGKTPRIISCSLKYPEEAISFYLSNDTLNYKSCLVKDSLFVYYDTVPHNPFYLITEADSLKISPRKTRSSIFSVDKLVDNTLYHPEESITIKFNQCLSTTTDSLIIVRDTAGISLPIISSIDSLGQLSIYSNHRDSTHYELQILPNAVSSFIQANKDTINYSYRTAGRDDYGDILIVCDSLDQEKSYVFNLISKRKIIRRIIVEDQKRDSLNFTKLKPGDYSIEVIEDIDKNNYWTPGSYKNRSAAERRVTQSLEKLRKGWDLSVSFDLNSLEQKEE